MICVSVQFCSMLLISFVVVMLSVILCMYVYSSIREEQLCRLLELNKLIIQINKSYKEFQVLPM